MSRANTAAEWARYEIGTVFSQSFGNINVPETSLSRLVQERNELQDRLAASEQAKDVWLSAATKSAHERNEAINQLTLALSRLDRQRNEVVAALEKIRDYAEEIYDDRVVVTEADAVLKQLAQ